jgi:hypothetical protein
MMKMLKDERAFALLSGFVTGPIAAIVDLFASTTKCVESLVKWPKILSKMFSL